VASRCPFSHRQLPHSVHPKQVRQTEEESWPQGQSGSISGAHVQAGSKALIALVAVHGHTATSAHEASLLGRNVALAGAVLKPARYTHRVNTLGAFHVTVHLLSPEGRRRPIAMPIAIPGNSPTLDTKAKSSHALMWYIGTLTGSPPVLVRTRRVRMVGHDGKTPDRSVSSCSHR
jgi:hypothetical protein